MQLSIHAACRWIAPMLLSACGLVISPPVHAVEGALGRPITGMQVTPFAGVIPPAPGMVWQLAFLHYEGDIGGGIQTPVGNQLALNLNLNLNLCAKMVMAGAAQPEQLDVRANRGIHEALPKRIAGVFSVARWSSTRRIRPPTTRMATYSDWTCSPCCAPRVAGASAP